MQRPPVKSRRPGFTLIELILVLVILAIVTAGVVPSLATFAAGRRTANAATLILGLFNYARTQAISQGTTYRLNFDAAAGTVWLTAQTAGTFQPPTNDYGQRFPLPAGVRMTVQVTPGSVSVPIQSPDVQQTTAQPSPPFGLPLGTPNTLVQAPHTDGGTYLDVQPGGQTDPVHVHLSDVPGNAIDLGAASATDVLHVLKPGEM